MACSNAAVTPNSLHAVANPSFNSPEIANEGAFLAISVNVCANAFDADAFADAEIVLPPPSLPPPPSSSLNRLLKVDDAFTNACNDSTACLSDFTHTVPNAPINVSVNGPQGFAPFWMANVKPFRKTSLFSSDSLPNSSSFSSLCVGLTTDAPHPTPAKSKHAFSQNFADCIRTPSLIVSLETFSLIARATSSAFFHIRAMFEYSFFFFFVFFFVSVSSASASSSIASTFAPSIAAFIKTSRNAFRLAAVARFCTAGYVLSVTNISALSSAAANWSPLSSNNASFPFSVVTVLLVDDDDTHDMFPAILVHVRSMNSHPYSRTFASVVATIVSSIGRNVSRSIARCFSRPSDSILRR